MPQVANKMVVDRLLQFGKTMARFKIVCTWSEAIGKTVVNDATARCSSSLSGGAAEQKEWRSAGVTSHEVPTSPIPAGGV